MTDGLRALREIAKKESQEQIAEALGVGQQFVSAVLRRRSRPGPTVRAIAEKKFGIQQDAWLSDFEKSEIAKSA